MEKAETKNNTDDDNQEKRTPVVCIVIASACGRDAQHKGCKSLVVVVADFIECSSKVPALGTSKVSQ